MRIAIYARESSDDTNKAPPITNQIERGKAWALEKGHEVVAVYADDGYSGGDWRRPEWNKAVLDAKRHYFKMLWVWNQDRLARDTEQFLWFYRNLRQGHAEVFSDTEGPINMETAGDRIKHTSLAMAAEAFRIITSEKVKRAYERNKAAGKPWGRKAKPLDMAKVRELRGQGVGLRTIAKQFGVSHITIKNRLCEGK